jgi:4-aminobutyrate aminotransferase-like enzyme
VVPVPINDAAAFDRIVAEHDRGDSKVAGFFHEIVLMNYGAILLKPEFLASAHKTCADRDIPVLIDEIQSCAWYPDFFLFRGYGLKPDFVAVGKGFPGGIYPASRVIASAPMDSLDQFGALVTNGQEELASLAYLVTMAFIRANAVFIEDCGEYYEKGLVALARKHERLVAGIEGCRHLASIVFRTIDDTMRFCAELNARGIDISAHTYKPKCPPAALTKLPLVSSSAMVDFFLAAMDEVLVRM